MCQVLLENEICILHKVVSKQGSMKCSKLPGIRLCVDLGPQKTQWTNTSRWHGSPNHHWLWKLYCSRVAWHKECDSWNPWSCIRLCVLVLEALTPAAVHSLWISPTFSNGFCFTILSRVRLSLLLVLFSTTSFPSLRLSINVLGHRALWAASLFCNDLLCLALLVQGVNGRLLDNCQVSSLPHDCVTYRTRLRDHLKGLCRCFELISWLECGTSVFNIEPFHNILIFWDTEFGVFISCHL